MHRLAADAAGRRADACSAYVAPVVAGPCGANLEVRQGVTVTRVLLARRGGRHQSRRRRRLVAVGVEYLGGHRGASPPGGGRGRRSTLRATRAVISAAGPYGSPVLLLRSGVGPAGALRAAGIPVAVDLPVGTRMQTRPYGQVDAEYGGLPLAKVNNVTLLRSPEAFAQWRAGRGGVLGTSAAAGLGRERSGSGSYLVFRFVPLRSLPGHLEYISACLSNPLRRRAL